MSVIRHPSSVIRLSRYWLLLGVTALAIAGLFSLVLVIARTPSLSNIPVFAELFHKALVVHVDLSVLVWFLSIACLMWSRQAAGFHAIFPLLEEAALISFGLGMAAIALSPLDRSSVALMSNYIPVITSPVFFLGLSLLLCGVGLMLVKLFLPLPLGEGRGEGLSSNSDANMLIGPHPNLLPEGEEILRFAIFTSALIALIAFMAFLWSYRQMPSGFDPQAYYELLFWGGGHTLQFLHIQMLMVCWVLLMQQVSGSRYQVSEKPNPLPATCYLIPIFSIPLIAALAVPFAYIQYNVDSAEHRNFFTQEMIIAGGIAPTLLALFIIPAAWRARAKNALWSTLAMSLLLFIYGGALGEMIQGQNVVIPAHYHGSIVGITLAFMGAAYLLLPEFGYRDVSTWKMAFWQPIVYGGGQLLHISGLAISGGYGVLRKTPGGMDGLSTGVKAAMGMMGLGGLIAIIGGFMFVIVVWRAVKRAR